MPIRNWQRDLGAPAEPALLHLRPSEPTPALMRPTTLCGLTVALIDTTTKPAVATCAQCLKARIAADALGTMLASNDLASAYDDNLSELEAARIDAQEARDLCDSGRD